MNIADADELALVYDFDGTLIQKESIDPLLEDLELDKAAFWDECDAYAAEHNIDSICAYLLKVFEKSAGKKQLTKDYLQSVGKRLVLQDGFEDFWLNETEKIGRDYHFNVKHYIISSGIADVMEGVPVVRDRFKKVFGSHIHRTRDGSMFPGRVVNYTNKTQYLFRISKGQLDERDEFAPNRKVDARPVPFKNMVFIGDGFTDVPCFAVMKEYGGYSMAVLGHKKNNLGLAETLIADKRVDCLSLQNHFTKDGILIKMFERFLMERREGGLDSDGN